MSSVLQGWSVAFLIIGVLLTLGGTAYRFYRREKEHYKGRSIASVVDIVPGPPDAQGKSAGIHDYYYPVFAYYANGRLMKERCPKGSNPPTFRLGEKVSIKYDTTSPERFILDHPTREDHLETFIYFAGLGLILAGCVCYLLFGLRILG